jgi:hypothetical protein
LVWQTFNESEMARSSECTDQYAQKVLDTADIVREAMFQQVTVWLALWPLASTALQDVTRLTDRT